MDDLYPFANGLRETFDFWSNDPRWNNTEETIAHGSTQPLYAEKGKEKNVANSGSVGSPVSGSERGALRRMVFSQDMINE